LGDRRGRPGAAARARPGRLRRLRLHGGLEHGARRGHGERPGPRVVAAARAGSATALEAAGASITTTDAGPRGRVTGAGSATDRRVWSHARTRTWWAFGSSTTRATAATARP